GSCCDVRVLDVRAGDRFALEPLDGFGEAADIGVEHLDGEALAHERVLAPVDGAHAALRDQLVDAIARGDDIADPTMCVIGTRRRDRPRFRAVPLRLRHSAGTIILDLRSPAWSHGPCSAEIEAPSDILRTLIIFTITIAMRCLWHAYRGVARALDAR